MDVIRTEENPGDVANFAGVKRFGVMRVDPIFLLLLAGRFSRGTGGPGVEVLPSRKFS